MTISFHGTPITPASQLARMYGEHFCVSFARPDNAGVCEEIGASVLWDNGAFSAYTKGKSFDEAKLYEWLEPRLYHPHRAVVRDVIDGDVETQRVAIRSWPFPRSLSWPVWHLDKSINYLFELCDSDWSGICLGSSGPYWEIGTASWERRMDHVFDELSRRGRLPWLHGLRMLGQIKSWPLASADSTNLAQNYARDTGCAHCKSIAIKQRQYGKRNAATFTGELFV